MSREEAIEVLQQDIPCEQDTDLIEALEMAIKALEQEPYDDAKYHEEHGEVIVDKAVWEDAKRALEQEPMRDATPEERESVDAYIKSISKPTGVDFDSLSDSQTIHHLTDKAYSELCLLAAKGREALQPSGDAVSRDFQIGDEVRIIGSDPIYDDCDVGWVIRNASERVKTMYVMRNDGSAEEENKEEWYKTGRHNTTLAEVIKALPSVKPQPKTGYWIKHDTGHSIYYDCSLCSCVAPCTETADKILWKLSAYCPDCGAKMENNGKRWRLER